MITSHNICEGVDCLAKKRQMVNYIQSVSVIHQSILFSGCLTALKLQVNLMMKKKEKKSSDSIMASEIVINYGVNYVQNLSRTKFDD